MYFPVACPTATAAISPLYIHHCYYIIIYAIVIKIIQNLCLSIKSLIFYENLNE